MSRLAVVAVSALTLVLVACGGSARTATLPDLCVDSPQTPQPTSDIPASFRDPLANGDRRGAFNAGSLSVLMAEHYLVNLYVDQIDGLLLLKAAANGVIDYLKGH